MNDILVTAINNLLIYAFIYLLFIYRLFNDAVSTSAYTASY
jgi:hypothetical protein